MARWGKFVPSFDRLEDRTVLDGNVSAVVIGKGLLITGDEMANSIRVEAISDSMVRVTGLENTTINGSSGPVVLGGIKKDININLKEGDDTIVLTGVTSRGSLRINLGEGNDSLTLTGGKVKRDFMIAGGDGEDNIQINGIKVKKAIHLDAGSGDDLVNIQNSKFMKRSAFNGGDGTDRLGIATTKLGDKQQTANFENAAASLFPLAADDTATLNEGATLAINVSSNDTAYQGSLNLASIVITTNPIRGTVTVNNNGTVSYTHDGSESTSDSFQYTIKDSQGLVTNIAIVTITITPVNENPVANNDTATLNEGASQTINVSTNDTDPENSINLASIVITDQPDNGSVVVNTNGTVSYTHNGSETTSDSFKYTIKDNTGNVSNEATVTITVTPTNDPPVAVNDADNVDEGATKVINLAANDSDAEGQLNLGSIVIVSNPAHGMITINTDGTVNYVHNGSEATTDTFTYTIKDTLGLTSSTATVTLTINPQNDAPVAVLDVAQVLRGGMVVISLAANDSDAENQLDLASIVIGTGANGPQHGMVTVNNNGTVTYTHDNSVTTTDSFTYTIKDQQGLESNSVTVTITINAP